jgi:lipopolysaccharide heptosyltransferase II
VKIDPQKIKKVLVIGLSCLGDMVMASAALWNLKLFLPNAKFTVWVGPRALGAVSGDPMWDEVMIYDRGGEFAGFKGRIKALKLMRSGKYDLIIDLRSTIMPPFSGARYSPLWGLREVFLPKTLHEAERTLQAMTSLGVPIKIRQLRFYIPQELRKLVKAKHSDKVRGRKLVIFNPGANWPPKRWPIRNFIELANLLILEHGVVIGVIGYSEEEQNLGRQVLDNLPYDDTLDLTGKVPLRELGALLETSSLFVTNDTGTLHIGSAVGVPMVGLYGPSSPERYGPWGTKHRVVAPPMSCAPCVGKSCLYDDFACISKIRVDDVFEACEELLN